ncbi:MAG: PTS sugar transporter subunit IIA [Gammaproteobacteria bacterium]|nr:PTS sugar transporter subunit IIA [Gammaproteobacteria bacterium]
MVDITGILSKECTRASVDAHSRKRAIEAAADLLAANHPELSARKLFDELMARERLGSTGLGEGVAIPHCRIPCQHAMGAFLHLGKGINYEAMDAEKVDLLFAFVVPLEETTAHLELLAGLARMFNDSENRKRLRSCGSDSELYEQLVGLFSSEAA